MAGTFVEIEVPPQGAKRATRSLAASPRPAAARR